MTHHLTDERAIIRLRWDQFDRYPAFTILAAVGVLVAVALAIFGLPPLNLHGPLHFFEVMGPTCGLTRGVMWTARGDLARAFAYNPASPLLVIGSLGAIARTIYGRSTGRWPSVILNMGPWPRVIAVILVVALTVRQQLNVDLLM